MKFKVMFCLAFPPKIKAKLNVSIYIGASLGSVFILIVMTTKRSSGQISPKSPDKVQQMQVQRTTQHPFSAERQGSWSSRLFFTVLCFVEFDNSCQPTVVCLICVD